MVTKAPRELIRCTFTFVKKISRANKREPRILRQRKMPRLKNRFISNLFILIAFSSPVECSKNVFWCEISQIVCSRCESLELRLFYRNLSSTHIVRKFLRTSLKYSNNRRDKLDWNLLVFPYKERDTELRAITAPS